MTIDRHRPMPRPREIGCMLWAAGWLTTIGTAATTFGWTGFFFAAGIATSLTGEIVLYCYANGI